jgi:hypothetical protein
VPAVDEAPDLPDVAVAVAGGERVVELVHREERPHPEVVEVVELRAHPRGVAGRA